MADHQFNYRPPSQPRALSLTLKDSLIVLALGNINGAAITAALFTIFGWGCQ